MAVFDNDVKLFIIRGDNETKKHEDLFLTAIGLVHAFMRQHDAPFIARLAWRNPRIVDDRKVVVEMNRSARMLREEFGG